MVVSRALNRTPPGVETNPIGGVQLHVLDRQIISRRLDPLLQSREHYDHSDVDDNAVQCPPDQSSFPRPGTATGIRGRGGRAHYWYSRTFLPLAYFALNRK